MLTFYSSVTNPAVDAGQSATDSTPVTVDSEEALLRMLNEWIKDHPGAKPPGALRLCRENLTYTPRKVIMTATLEPARASYHQISETHMAWFLEVNVKTFMLVKIRSSKPGPGHYFAWLGGDLGFTAHVITHPAGGHRRKRPRNRGTRGAIKPRDVPKSYEDEAGSLVDFIDTNGAISDSEADKSSTSLDSDSGDENIQLHQLNVPAHHMGYHGKNIKEERQSRRLAAKAQRYRQPKLQESSITSQRSSNYTQRQHRPNVDYQMRSPVSVSSRPIPERAPRTPKRRRSSLSHERYHSHSRQSARRKQHIKPPCPPTPKRERSSSVEILSRLPTPASTRQDLVRMEAASRSNLFEIQSHVPQMATSRCLDPSTTAKPVTPSCGSEPVPKGHVVFQFLLADESNGAIPKPLNQCDTVTAFFDEAIAAWGALDGAEQYPKMVAVTVALDSVSRPIVVPWRNKGVFDTMVAAVIRASRGRLQGLEVEVRCKRAGG